MISINEISSWLAGGFGGTGLAAYLIKATALLLVAWGLSFGLQRAAASARHSMWMAALCAIFVLPVLSGALPAWRVALLPAEVVAPRTPEPWLIEQGARAEFAPVLDAGSSSPAARSPIRAGVREVERPSPWLLVWALGVALLGLRLLVSALSAWRLAREATPITDELVMAEVTALREKLGIRSEVSVVESARVGMPMAWGMLEQIIFLPAEAREWSEERRRVVLLHELAHLKRRDCETLMLARLVAVVHWFNPLVWVAVRKIQAEREHACDDLVLTAGTAGTDYAHHLLDIARGMRSSFTRGWAMVAMARPSELEGRLLAILDPSLDRRQGKRAAHLVGVLLIALIALPLAAVQPKPNVEPTRPEETSMPESIVVETPSTSSNETQRTQAERRTVPTRTVTTAEEPSPSSRPRRDARLVEVFSRALGDADPETRAQAAHSLGMIEEASAIPRLGQVLREDSAEPVRVQAAWALGMIEDAAAGSALRAALSDPSGAVREQAAWALGMIEDDQSVAALCASLADDHAGVRDRAAWALGMIESDAGADALGVSLEADDQESVRGRAAWALGMIGSAVAVESLISAVEGDTAPTVRERAVWALGMIGSESALDTLLNAMTDESEAVRQRALWAVGRIADA